MNRFRAQQWSKLVVVLAACVVVLGGVNGAAAAALCKKVNGKLTLQTFAGPGCLSRIGLCATGAFTGDIAGTIAFTGTSFTETDDTPTTSVVFVTGDNVITTDSGILYTKDAIVLQQAAPGNFTEVDVVVGGTGVWDGASGTITAGGVFGANGGEGRYKGEICTP